MTILASITAFEEIRLRYVIVHSIPDLEQELTEIFRQVLSVQSAVDVSDVLQLHLETLDQGNANRISVAEIQVSDSPYTIVKQFEHALLGGAGISELYKTFDSEKMEDNQVYLRELYEIEMRIREVYTVLTRLQGVKIEKAPRVKLVDEYRRNREMINQMLMNEFFYIEFSNYKNVDEWNNIELEKVLDVLKRAKKIEDISGGVSEILRSTLPLVQRLQELSRIPEAIGKLEKFRNCIAHNRFPPEDAVENFLKAKAIIDEVYEAFIAKLKDKTL